MLRIVAPNGVKVGCRLGRCGMLFAHVRHCDVKSFSTNKSVRLGPSKRKEVLCCLLVAQWAGRRTFGNFATLEICIMKVMH